MTSGAEGKPGRAAAAEENPAAEGIVCASPPCFLHELDPAWLEALRWEDIRAWRKRQRTALIAQRIAMPLPRRRDHEAAIMAHLRTAYPDLGRRRVGFYWPFKGEFDPRPLARALHEAGASLSLPVVERRAQPLAFRAWQPGARMTPGVWNIPVPADGEATTPEVLLVPLVGFDAKGYRLGYGGGYYDRTLASLAPRPIAIGLGFEGACLATIFPQAHDVRMDAIVTEAGARVIA